jgi:replicative DNA helicase
VADADDILRRVPPQNLEAEQSVLGAVLLDNHAINQVLEILAPEDFYREQHRLIFQAMSELTDRHEPVDAITLTDALRSRGVLDAVGGPKYIADLAAFVPTAANAAYYARIVHDKAVLRGLATIATEIASAAFDEPANVDEFLDESEHRVFEISERRVKPAFHSMRELTMESLKLVEQLHDRRELVTGVPTGFMDLDRITAGLQPSDLIIIAARPSMGKTALALNIATFAACRADPPVGVAFFSLEMSKEQLVLRLLCSEARVDLARARTGTFRSEDFTRLAHVAAELSEAKIFIDDSSDLSPITLKAKCRRLARDRSSNLGLVVVDYLQLMRSSRPSGTLEAREKEIAEISRSLKALAKELRVPVVALSQLNRQVELRADRRPILADLRESGAIEQDADVIAFIFRDEVYKGKESKTPGVAEVLIAKQRNGPTGTVELTYISQFTRFENYAQDRGVYEEAEG